MKKLICGMVGFIGVCVYVGFAIGQLTYQPKVVEVERIEYITVVQEVPYYVPVEVEKPYYVTIVEKEPYEVIVPRDIRPRSFTSVNHFKEWYNEQDPAVLFSNSEDTDYNGYAKDLQRGALRQGYSISQALAKDGRYFGEKVTSRTGIHIGNLVLIKDTYYWVEPNPEKFKIIKLVEQD